MSLSSLLPDTHLRLADPTSTSRYLDSTSTIGSSNKVQSASSISCDTAILSLLRVFYRDQQEKQRSTGDFIRLLHTLGTSNGRSGSSILSDITIPSHSFRQR